MSTVMIIGLVCAVLFVFFIIGCLCNWMENKTEDDSEELPEWWTKDNPPVDNEEIKKEINKSVNDLETRKTKPPIKKTPAKKVASSGNARQNRDDAFHDNLLLNASLMDTMDSPSSSSCSPSSSSSSSSYDSGSSYTPSYSGSSDSGSSFSSSSSSFSSSDSGGGGCF